jgi:hypothetical protein
MDIKMVTMTKHQVQGLIDILEGTDWMAYGTAIALLKSLIKEEDE